MLKFLKNDDGFSLLEAILSVAVISVVSVFILQMFITSANANKKTQAADSANVAAISLMEEFRAMASFKEALDTLGQPGARVERAVGENENFYLVYTLEEENSAVTGAVPGKITGDSYEPQDGAGRLIRLTVEAYSIVQVVTLDNVGAAAAGNDLVAQYSTTKYFTE